MSAPKPYYFVELMSGPTLLRCWVDRPVDIENLITLKDSDEPDRLWKVVSVYSGETKTKAELSDQSKWKVGGL